MISYAQNFEDVYIARAFSEVTEGFYVDLGAYHPEHDSVTNHFYKAGWTGINVEPGPTFETFACRTRDLNLNIAVAAEDGEAVFFYHEADPGTSTLLTSLQRQLVGRVGRRREIRTPCLSLDRILQTYASGRHIHFLKIDIEGAEREVIEATDWELHRPELLVIEATLPYTNTRRDEWGETLTAHRYVEVFFDGINTYHLREESLHRRIAFNRPINVLDGAAIYDPEVVALRTQVAELQAALANVTPTGRSPASDQLASLDVRGPVKVGDGGSRDVIALGDPGEEASRGGVYLSRRDSSGCAPGAVLHVGGFDGVQVHVGDTPSHPTAPKLTVGREVLTGVPVVPQIDGAVALGSATQRFSTLYATKSPVTIQRENEIFEIAPTNLGMPFLRRLRPVAYLQAKAEGDRGAELPRRHQGLLAEEVAAAAASSGEPDFAGVACFPDGSRGVRYDEFVPCMIRAIQQLAEEIESLRGGGQRASTADTHTSIASAQARDE